VIDFGALFTQLLAAYWWLLPLFILAALFKSVWFKSKKGSVPLARQSILKQAFSGN